MLFSKFAIKSVAKSKLSITTKEFSSVYKYLIFQLGKYF